MLSTSYSEAAVEVLDILNHMNVSDFQKVPIKFIEFLEENQSKDYKVNFDYSNGLQELDLKDETKGILGLIYQEYWCNEKEKAEYLKVLHENEVNFQEEISKKYNKDDLFKKEEIEEVVLNDLETENKLLAKNAGIMNFFSKLVFNIKSIFSKK